MIVPSRGRPENIKRLIKAFAETITIGTKLIVVVDIDDPVAVDYMKVMDAANEWSFASLYVQSAASSLGPILNYTANQYAPFANFIGFMGDDHLPRTVGWDGRLCARLGAKAGVAYGNDLFQGENLPTAVVLSARIIGALGYMVPPLLRHMYLDNFWKQLGEDLDHLVYMPDVIIEHIHPFAGKAEMDDGYKRVNTQSMYNEDGLIYTNFMRNEWPSQLLQLRTGLL